MAILHPIVVILDLFGMIYFMFLVILHTLKVVWYLFEVILYPVEVILLLFELIFHPFEVSLEYFGNILRLFEAPFCPFLFVLSLGVIMILFHFASACSNLVSLWDYFVSLYLQCLSFLVVFYCL